MFTGIIESTGIVEEITGQGTGKTFLISSPISPELKPDQSVAHNGVCLTVEQVSGSRYQVTAIRETLLKTNLTSWTTGTPVNLERCLPMNGRLDGHIVQGHVDATAVCLEKKDCGGSWEFRFGYPDQFRNLVIEKGSICLNGISLTVFGLKGSEFSVAIIPYTYEHTNIHTVNPGDQVNVEFDVVGKYIVRMQSSNQ